METFRTAFREASRRAAGRLLVATRFEVRAAEIRLRLLVDGAPKLALKI